jgi:ABC-2 type transport system permease protein
MIDESMAQYSALMVMEKDYGADHMRKFLRHELDRYLRGRTQEMDEEAPLMLVGNQSYIYYAKGSLVMYALREYIGEETFNTALRKYIKATAFQGPPYTNSIEFLSYVRDAVPEAYQYLIEDMFETITLYDKRSTIEQSKRRCTARNTVSRAGQGISRSLSMKDRCAPGSIRATS